MDRMISRRVDEALRGRGERPVVIITGMRRVGKTTELKRLEKRNKDALYFDLEDVRSRSLFKPAVADLEAVVGRRGLLLLDEIQYLEGAGRVLKLLHDHFPDLRVAVTGSASFLMLKKLGDSLVGRNVQFEMWPLTWREICNDTDNKVFSWGGYDRVANKATIESRLEEVMLFGSLPQVYTTPDKAEKVRVLEDYTNSLLFKDVLEIEGIRNPGAYKRLLMLIALQVGSEINPNELARSLEVSRKTVVEYIGLFEKFRVVYRLGAYSTNLRKELVRGFKVYFTDLGVRNALIGNFAPLSGRTDIGAMFENAVMNTIRSNIDYLGLPYAMNFWRKTAGGEVDLVLSYKLSQELAAVEIKWGRKSGPTRSFKNAYGERVREEIVISRDNYWKFV